MSGNPGRERERENVCGGETEGWGWRKQSNPIAESGSRLALAPRILP